MLTHIVRYIFRMRTYRIQLVLVVVVTEVTFGVFLGHFRNSVSICTKLARSILMKDRNIVTEPNFRKSYSSSKTIQKEQICRLLRTFQSFETFQLLTIH